MCRQLAAAVVAEDHALAYPGAAAGAFYGFIQHLLGIFGFSDRCAQIVDPHNLLCDFREGSVSICQIDLVSNLTVKIFDLRFRFADDPAVFGVICQILCLFADRLACL